MDASILVDESTSLVKGKLFTIMEQEGCSLWVLDRKDWCCTPKEQELCIQHLPSFEARSVLNKQDSEGKLALKSKQVEKAAAYWSFFVWLVLSLCNHL